MEHYERLEKIGEGAAGVVYKARDRRTGATVAIKLLRRGGVCYDDAQLSENLLREARCLQACRGHPCLVEPLAAGREGANAFLVMEYVGPSLACVMRERGGAGRAPFPEAEARRLMRQLLDGAAAMHGHGVLHRDLKPENVLVDAHGNLKICDFGLSRFAANTPGASAEPYTSSVVTLWYRAPELLLGSTEYDAGVDTWALGCIMAELLAGAPLLPGRTEMDQLNKTFDTVGTDDMTDWPSFARLPRAGSPLCQRTRPPSRLREMFPALSAAGLDVLSGLLACRPDRRLTAADALRRPWFTDAESADQPRIACGARFSERVGGAADAIVV
jgi:cell division cycle 2-like protein